MYRRQPCRVVRIIRTRFGPLRGKTLLRNCIIWQRRQRSNTVSRSKRRPNTCRALAATREQSSLEKSSTSTLRKIVNQLVNPTLGPVHDPAFAYRNLKEEELADRDREILDELKAELKQDWSDKEE